MLTEKLVLDVEELGSHLGIGRELAYELVKKPGFPVIRVGKRILVPYEPLKQWLVTESAKTVEV